jgi:hypothetical protein
MRAFNHSQRLKHQSNWAFTVFVVNSQNDVDGTFAPGGSFSRAFAFAGGLFFVTPSTRPASTFAHETGHMFWARDEYAGGGNYLQKRGYYDTQNLNASDLNPNPNFQQATSIMTAGGNLDDAYNQVVSPPSTLAMLGWQDSDGDGVFDVLDVPLTLEGYGRWSSFNDTYRFQGSAQVNTLPNLNSSGLQNDITLNRVSRIEYRLDSGTWQTAAQPNSYRATIDLSIPMTPLVQQVEIRAIDALTGVTSNVFVGRRSERPDAVTKPNVNGFVWNDVDADGLWDAHETGAAGWRIQLLGPQGQEVSTQRVLDADDRSVGVVPSNAFPGFTLTATGNDTDGRVNVANDSNASTGSRVFQPFSNGAQAFAAHWRGGQQALRVDISNAARTVSVDVIGAEVGSRAKLEAYTSAGVLLGRATTDPMNPGEVRRLEWSSRQADIAYLSITGHGSSAIKIDQVRVGAANAVLTDVNGRYNLGPFASGSYQVQASPPSGITGPIQSIALVDQQDLSHVDIASSSFNASPWFNLLQAEDVDGSATVTALDALLVINVINERGSIELDGSGIGFPPWIDVNNDRRVTALDALIVINYINEHSDFGSSGEGEYSAGPDDSSWDDSSWDDSSRDDSSDAPWSSRRRRRA